MDEQPQIQTEPTIANPQKPQATSSHHRGIMLAAVVIIVIALVAYLGLNSLGYIPNISITPSSQTSTLSTTTSIAPQGTVSTTTIGSGSGFQGCIGSGTQAIPNGDFATGTYADWNTTGIGFGSAPVNITSENANGNYYGSPWTGYDHTYFATTFTGGLSIAPGNLTSQVFEVTEPYLNFQIVSSESQNLYIEILKNGQPAIRDYYNTRGSSGSSSSAFQNASISLSPLLCSNVTIRIVADVIGNPATRYQSIAAGGFYLSQNPLNNASILYNESILTG